MAFHHLRTLCQLLIIVLCADAVKAGYSPIIDSVPNAAQDLESPSPWGNGFLANEFSDDQLYPNAASSVEPLFDLEDDGSEDHDLGVVDESDLDYDALSPRGQRPHKGERPKHKPVAVNTLPSSQQLGEPLIESPQSLQTDDSEHPTQPREKGTSQRPTPFPGMDRLVPNGSALQDPGTRNRQSSGNHYINTGIPGRLPAVSKPLSSRMPSRRKPAVSSRQSVRRVPGFVQSSARRPSGFTSVRRPPFSYDHAERPSVASDVTWGSTGVGHFPYGPQSAGSLPLGTYSAADRSGPRVGPYGLVHGGYRRPLEGPLSSNQYGSAYHGHRRPSESSLPSGSYGWVLDHFIPNFQSPAYDVPLSPGLMYNGHVFPYGSVFPSRPHDLTRGHDSAYGSSQRGYFHLPPSRPNRLGFPQVPIPGYIHNGEMGSYAPFHGGHHFPVHYPHGGHVVQSKTNLEHGRVQFAQTSYLPWGVRPVFSSTTSGRRSHSDNRPQQSWNHHVTGGYQHGY